ncbi:MAG: S8 family serine peptidase [Gammaproteobacteria bacterium]|nr:S8 family serine peptidase [Gammaproteobacteria bacterium]
MISSIHAQSLKTNNIKKEAVKITKLKDWSSLSRSPIKQKIQIIEGLQGNHSYIVRLIDAPVATYRGGIPGYKATAAGYVQNYSARKKTINANKVNQPRTPLKLDLESGEVKQYQRYLKLKQDDFLQHSSEVLGFKPATSHRLQFALNGVIMRMTQGEAKQIAALKEVSYVEREQTVKLDTDTGPRMIGAGSVWDGSATSIAHQGEGIIVGIIDTGINTDHPSFAAEAADGYVHTNPFGNGVYVGDCANGFPDLCNSKLIGVRSYATITDFYQDDTVFGPTPPAANGEDYNGHGSHVSSTAAGNTLYNVDLISTEYGVEESDGIVSASGFQFSEISGVAPRANLISYQVCRPGDPTDTHTGCPTPVILQSIDDAITDGVDVLNMSLSGGGDPWSYSMAQAFLAAQDAGIFVAISAGNTGPAPSTTEKSAPWYTSVAAATHDRIININDKQIRNFIGGDTSPPGTITGQSNTGTITATIVYAGDYTNANDDPANDPAQCLAPYPAGTFSGQIVLCDRGDIARVEKAQNVAAGGAAGFVLANLQDGSTNLVNDAYQVPGIHVSATDGDTIKTWLATGAGHSATITESTVSTTIGQADIVASFSSRGSNLTVPDIMAPTVAAPGVSIYAAYSDQQFGHDISGTAPADFSFLQGTSMASPHVAGAGALLKSVHSAWTPDNIRSALMMTAERSLVKEDGSTPADIYDMGSGRIQVDLAAKTGLVMDETSINYTNANPAIGGEPKTLNIPSMGDTDCRSLCGWSRTLTATKNSHWTISTTSNNDNVEFTVSPVQFSITEGNNQTIEVSASASDAHNGEQATGWVTLTSDNADIPEVHLPVFVTIVFSNLPVRLDLDVSNDVGSTQLLNIEAIEITNLTSQVKGLQKATITDVSLQEDSNKDTPYEDLSDGVKQYNISLPEDSPLLWADFSEATAQDMDLYIGRDDNNNGLAEASEELCNSTTPSSQEECLIESVLAGNYWILVHNYTASVSGATDTVKLRNTYVSSADNNNLTISGPVVVPNATPFDIRLDWNDDMTAGDSFIGIFELFTSNEPAIASSLGQTIITLNRIEIQSNLSIDDPGVLSVDEDSSLTGITVTFTDNDANLNLVEVVSDSGTITNLTNTDSDFTFDLIPDADFNGDITVTTTVTDTVNSMDTTNLNFIVQVVPVNDAPVVTASSSLSQSTLTLTANATDIDNDTLTYSWNQTDGPTVSIANANSATATVSNANANTGTLTFQISVSDTSLSVTESTSISVTAPTTSPSTSNSGGGGGSTSQMFILLLTMSIYWRRRQLMG